MNKSENTLLIWVLTTAGILLAILYSPLGSPDLYYTRNYFSENQSVDFYGAGISKGLKNVGSIQSKVSSLKSSVESFKSSVESLKTISNSRKSKGSDYGSASDLNVPNVADKNKKRYQSSSADYSGINNRNGSTNSPRINKSGASIANSGVSVSNNSQSGNNSGSNGGGSSESFSSRSHSNSHASSNSQNTAAITGVSVNLSSIDSTSLLASNYSAQKSTQFIDPGPGDPLGEPVPIPEGWGYLALLAVAYSLYIVFKNKRQAATKVSL